jgi:hypothetical protein
MQRCARILGIVGLGLGVACGGGGSGESGAGEAAITTDDAPFMTAEVMRALAFSSDVGGVGSASEDSEALSAADATVLRGASGVTAAIVVPPTEIPCGAGGSQTISGDVANPLTPTQGDRFDTDFHDCQEEEDGPILNGDFDFVVLSFAGDFDTGIYNWRLDVDLMDFRIEQDSDEIEFDGNVQLIQDTLEPDLSSSILSGGTLTATDETDHSITLQNFFVGLDQEVDGDGEDRDYVLDGTGILTSSLFTGRVRFDVFELFEGEIPDPPTTGSMVITGADDATITVEPFIDDDDDVVVRLTVDTDGEEGPVEPVELPLMTWDEIFDAEPVSTPSPGPGSGSTIVVIPLLPPPPPVGTPVTRSARLQMISVGAGGVVMGSQIRRDESGLILRASP